ncbi:unnamed protein product [Mesocestoides corti]|uniref:Cyclin-like domain-containing protein n=2 Tax=Mesocestoides corti TaxID=53468 RepID=A0A3P6GPR1_MESCO|nr:unnamed protein product [Mesocestoides corti]
MFWPAGPVLQLCNVFEACCLVMGDLENAQPIGDKTADEGPSSVPQPATDVYFSANETIIRDLLSDELRYHSPPAYCQNEPPAQAIWMRRALLNWLREVCDHRNTDAEVLAHAAQLIDRYLHVGNTDKRDYQLVGATCFLLASKLKETIPVLVERLVQYTDFSVTKEDILAKEIVIAVTLQWDLTCITPIDFIHPITSFFTCESGLRQLIRQSAKQIFMKILHVEGVNLFRPSYTAAACILYAVRLTVAPDADGFASGVRSQMERLLGLESVSSWVKWR